MNTEQLKTDPSNTESKLLEIKNQIACENGIASWYDINIYSRANFVNDVAFRFASQESQRAVDEFKEKLRKKFISQQWTFTDVMDKHNLDIKIINLIDKL